MNWKLISKNNCIVNKELDESYELSDVKDCLRLLKQLNDYSICQSDLDDIIKSLEWENDNLKMENKYLQRYVRNHMIQINDMGV